MSELSQTEFAGKAERVASLINTARRLLDEGQVVELNALTGHVADLCKYVTSTTGENLAAKESSTVRGSIEQLLHSLEELEVDMVKKHREVSDDLTETDRLRANKAYKSTEEEKP